MIIPLLLLASVTADSMKDLDVKIGYLAEDELVLFAPTRADALENADVRAEMLRVGFPAGCDLISGVATQVDGRNSAAMTRKLVESIDAAVPRKVLAKARYLSFTVTPLDKYREKVAKKFSKSAASELAASRADMLASTKAAFAEAPSATHPGVNNITPRPDVAARYAITGAWDFSKASHMAQACAAQRLGPATPPSEGSAE